MIGKLIVAAALIGTSDWGYVWERPEGMSGEVPDTSTPGSDSYSTTRLHRGFAWAFLDGYDVRAVAELDAVRTSPVVHYGPSASDTSKASKYLSHTNVASRTAWNIPSFNYEGGEWMEQMYARRFYIEQYLRFSHAQGHIDPVADMGLSPQVKKYSGEVMWGGAVLDRQVSFRGYPTEHDFEWKENPADDLWGNGGSGWFPAYAACDPSSELSPFYQNSGFGTEVMYYPLSEVSVGEPTSCSNVTWVLSNLTWPVSNSLPFTVDDVFTNSVSFSHLGYVMTPVTNVSPAYAVTSLVDGVETVSYVCDTNISVSAEFTRDDPDFRTNFYDVATRSTMRLDYDTLSFCVQLLSCFDRLYRPLSSVWDYERHTVTNFSYGQAFSEYFLEGSTELSVHTSGHGSSVTVDNTNFTYSVYLETNSFSVTDSSCQLEAPRARVSDVSASASGSSSTGRNGRSFANDLDLTDGNLKTLAPAIWACIANSGSGTYFLDLDTSGGSTLYSYGDGWTNELVSFNFDVDTLFADGTFKILPRASVGYQFSFSQATNAFFRANVHPDPRYDWTWPRNREWLATGREEVPPICATFFESYCTVTNGSVHFPDTIGTAIDYDGDGDARLWAYRDGFGYRCHRHRYATAEAFANAFNAELKELSKRVCEYIGGDLTRPETAFRALGADADGAVRFANSYLTNGWHGAVTVSCNQEVEYVYDSITTNFPTVVTNVTPVDVVDVNIVSNWVRNAYTFESIAYLEYTGSEYVIHQTETNCVYSRRYSGKSVLSNVVHSVSNVVVTANGHVCYVSTNVITSVTGEVESVVRPLFYPEYYPGLRYPYLINAYQSTNIVDGVTNVVWNSVETIGGEITAENSYSVLTNGYWTEDAGGPEWEEYHYYIDDDVFTNRIVTVESEATRITETIDDPSRYITYVTNGLRRVYHDRASFSATVDSEEGEKRVTLHPSVVHLFSAGLGISCEPSTNSSPYRIRKAIDTNIRPVQSADYSFPNSASFPDVP